MTTQPILLAEDNPDDAELMMSALGTAGITNRVYHVSNGQAAIDYFAGVGLYANRQEYPLPFLVLLDLKLPLVHGFDVLRWIRAQPNVRAIVIVLSASARESDIATAHSLHANAYVVKPSSLRELNALLQAIKTFWIEMNEWSSANVASVAASSALLAPSATR